jgi:F-type H+-transporting ATPase subunit epsilon
MAPLTCRVLTPAAVIFEGPAWSIVLPAHDGELGILDRHAPLITMLGMGEVRLQGEEGIMTYFAVDGGFAQVRDNIVTILATRADAGVDLDCAALAADLERLKNEAPTEFEERHAWKREVAWQQLRRRVAQATVSPGA